MQLILPLMSVTSKSFSASSHGLATSADPWPRNAVLLLAAAQGTFIVVGGVLTIVLAIFGVFAQNYAIRLAKWGEVPDASGAFLGGVPGDIFETQKQWHRDKRAYYRHSSAELILVANNLLMGSVIAGVSLSWIIFPRLEIAAIVLVFCLLANSARQFYVRMQNVREAEELLESRRKEINNRVTPEYKYGLIPQFDRVKL